MSRHTKALIFNVSSKLGIVSVQKQSQIIGRWMSSKFKPPSIYEKRSDFIEASDEFIEDILEEKLNQPEIHRSGKIHSRKSAVREAEEQHRKFIKRKIIEKKENSLFGPKQPNLLTWAARVQIKYLNKSDPYYWTPEMLAESFPVSKDVIVKILKNSRLPYDENEIFKHDQRVYRNWLKLKDAKKKLASGGPVDPDYRLIAESSKLGLIKNAAGSKSLPMPDGATLLLTQTAIAECRKPKVRSEFSAILEDYRKDKEVLKKDKELKQIEIADPEYVALLEEISDNSEEKDKTKTSADSAKSDADIEDFLDVDYENPNDNTYIQSSDEKKNFNISNDMVSAATRKKSRRQKTHSAKRHNIDKNA